MRTAKPHLAAVYIFCLALVSILAITGVPELAHWSFNPVYNLRPFVLIFSNTTEYILNVILFVPFGFLLPLNWKRLERWYLTFFSGFFLSMSIEVSQLFNNRVTDIDDLTMNTVGTMVGYLIFLLVKRMIPGSSVFSVGYKNHWKWEPFFCFCFAWISMLAFKNFLAIWFFGSSTPMTFR